MSRIARKCTLFRFAVLLLWTPLFGQSAPPATQSTTFHIGGTISGGGRHVLLALVFEGVSSQTVITNQAGVYEANLPLGLWTMTVRSFALDSAGKVITDTASLYRRPPFRVTAPTSLVFDISLPRGILCTMIVIAPDGGPATQEQQDDAHAWCVGEEFFPVPSDDVPFEVHVWGGLHFAACQLVSNNRTVRKHTFATYNTLSVQADDITYDRGESILEAQGNVVTQDESGEHKAPSMTFYIHDGQATPIP